MKGILYSVIWSCIALLIVNCSPSNQAVKNEISFGVPSAYDVNRYAMDKLICDPLGGDGGQNVNRGIYAELYYADFVDSDTDSDQVQTYFDKGTKVENPIFFSDLNIPTRAFDLGFPTQTGDVLKNEIGTTLFEFFALKMYTTIGLSPDQEPGYYEFALLSDDGARIQFENSKDEIESLVDNDGDHMSRFGCGNVRYFDHDTFLKVEIDYYQGPKHHLSLIPMWKKVPSEVATGDPECGMEGNDYFFDPDNNSVELTPYQEILSRGWEPLQAGNYFLDSSKGGYNPCVEGTSPVISDFEVISYEDSALIVTWKTNIPATSQVLYKDYFTDDETLTESDNRLRTEHRVVIPNLPYGGTYEVQGISISEDYGKASSVKKIIAVR